MHPSQSRRHVNVEPPITRDRGVVTAVEMMFLLVFALAAVGFLGFLGRLHAAGVQVTNASQSAARAASLTADSDAGRAAAQATVDDSTLLSRCSSRPEADLEWEPSVAGTWQGGSVTVTITCTVANADLSGVWSPGRRTISVSDTQAIDRYKR
jgi:Flp pilus assembly protein TadG